MTEYDRFKGAFLPDPDSKGRSNLLVRRESVSKKEKRLKVLRPSFPSDGKKPYRMQCQNGSGCNYHNWSKNSPVRMVCKNGPGCPKHYWGEEKNLLTAKCFNGDQDCRYHNDKGFMTRHSLDLCEKPKKLKKRMRTVPKQKPKPEPEIPQLEPAL